MGMVVQHNMNAINAYNRLNANVAGMKKSSEKLSSGYRINRAGDDAAGLAVSEKMRSQIKGLNQAIRNSQDGINMIQTFEGAAQESHSILQRMKELATQSANGTYDNATDRAAMQLEFNQLNDELNQIADTDFNGTIVLNGGEMADGLRAVDGDFDYANKKDQLIDDATKMASDAVTKATDDYYAALKKFQETPYDLSSNGNAPEWKSVGENKYGKALADKVWIAAGITNEAGDEANVDRITSLDVTFTYDGEAKEWKASGVTTNEGKALALPDGKTEWSEVFTVVDTKNPAASATGEGGFQVQAGADNDVISNLVFDETGAKTGDTVTIKLTNSKTSMVAPNNATWANDSIIGKDGSSTIVLAGAEQKLGLTGGKTADDFAITMAATDDKMDEDLAAALEALNGVTVNLETKATATNKSSWTKVEIGGQTFNTGGASMNAGICTANGEELTVTDKDGNTQHYFVVSETNADATGNKLTIYNATTADGGLNYSKGDIALVEINATELGKAAANYDNTDASTIAATEKSSFSGTLAIATAKYDAGATPDIEAADNPALESSKEASKMVADAQKVLTDAQKQLADLTGADDKFAAAKDFLTKKNVSISDAYDNSTARLLYTDNITLQTGARSKDAVNFTFKYNQDDTVDMRGLEPNLNISARKDGLNTENLSIANADDANYAMDQIDKAINKVSMVRANFGAMQNRLDHKITNLTTTSENLTEAESAIRDTDMASEMMNYTKFNILQQAAQSMLAQANQQPQSILQLLG